MSLSKQEIIDYASRYVDPNEVTDFPLGGDLFCIIGRDLPRDGILAEEEGWGFQGYGICLEYSLDQESKPVGAWLWMRYASLMTFPPTEQAFKLQPPHVVKGRFQNPGRINEFRIIKINLSSPSDFAKKSSMSSGSSSSSAQATQSQNTSDINGKIIRFRPKKNI